MSIWIWLLIAVGIAILLVVIKVRRKAAEQWMQDQAVLQDFRRWSTGESVGGQSTKKTGLDALGAAEERIRQMRASGYLDNPVCGGCGTIYDRIEVVEQLRQQSPEMFAFGTWSTKFRCKTCQGEVEISGSTS